MKVCFIILLVSLCVYGIVELYDDSLDYKWRECEVLNKLTAHGRSSKFIFVLREKETNTVFDLYVSAATYTQSGEGDSISFYLRDYDIDGSGNGLISVLRALSWSITFTMIIFIIVMFIGMFIDMLIDRRFL